MKGKTQPQTRAVAISLFVDYTDTACSRLLKQPIPITRPIMRGRLLPIFWAKIS